MGFLRQEYWSGFSLPSPGDLADPGTEPTFPVLPGEFFTTKPPGKPALEIIWSLKVLVEKSYCLELGESKGHAVQSIFLYSLS